VIQLSKGLGLDYGVQHHFQQYFSYIVAVSFYWWRKPEYSEKTTDLSWTPECDLYIDFTLVN